MDEPGGEGSQRAIPQPPIGDGPRHAPLGPAGPGAAGAAQHLEAAVRRWRAGERELERELFVLGAGPIPVSDTHAGAVGVDRDGRTVLVTAARSLTVPSIIETVDHLDRIAQLGSRLGELETETYSADPLELRHARFFDLPRSEKPQLNHAQEAVLLVEEPPADALWKTIFVEFGPLLGDVFQCDADGARLLRPPEEMLRVRGAPSRTWPLGTWIGLLIVLLGAGLAILALARLLEPEEVPPVLTSVQSPIRDVVAGVGIDATHTQWIGQQRSVRTSRGNVFLLFPNQGALQLVSDHWNQGRAWRSPITVDGIRVDSFSAAIDARDRIHLVFQEPSGVAYTRLERTADGWESGDVLELDSATTSHVVDLAWDEANNVAQIVWAAQGADGEEVMWSAVRHENGVPTVLDEAPISEPGAQQTGLATIDVDPTDAEVLVTYRAPDETAGWFSKVATQGSTGSWTWGIEERLPIEDFVGAASAAFDRRGTAHLILRDSTNFDLEYFKRTDRAGWTSPETVFDGSSIEHIDMPVLAVDDASRLIYLFFQSNEFNPNSEVRLAIRDPAIGWEGPFEVAPANLIPEGAAFPTVVAPVDGQSLVFWTKGGGIPTIQIARVSAP